MKKYEISDDRSTEEVNKTYGFVVANDKLDN